MKRGVVLLWLCIFALLLLLGPAEPASWPLAVGTLQTGAQSNVPEEGPFEVHARAIDDGADSFRYGVNFGFRNTSWKDPDYADLAAAAGATSHRPKLPEYHFDSWGYDIELDDMEHYHSVGLTDMAAFLVGPSRDHSTAPPEVSNWQLDFYAPKNLYEPIWLQPGVVNPNNYWAAYVYETVSRYHPYVRVWEVWNEPDWTGNWSATQNEWWTQPPDPNDLGMWHDSVFAYVRMLRITHEVVGQVAPDDGVAVGGFGYPSFLDAVLRYTDNPVDGSVTADYPSMGGAYFDTLSYHIYPQYEVTSLETGQTFRGWNSDEATDGFLARRRNFEWVLENHGYDGLTQPRKLWLVTETGMASKPVGSYAGGGALMRNYLIKMPVAAQAAGLMAVHWYLLTDEEADSASTSPYRHMGLYLDVAGLADTSQAQRKADAYAYETVSQLLDGATYDHGRTSGLNLPPEARGFVFRGSDDHLVYILWARTSGTSESASASVTLSADDPIRLRRWDYAATGAVELLKPVSGQVTVVLDGSPVFLTSISAEEWHEVYLPLVIRE